jgi:5'-3' exonuclease
MKNGGAKLLMSNDKNVLIVDGMALLFRAYYASAYGGYIQKTKAGIPTNAVNGFVKYLWNAVQAFSPTHVVCCWDMGSRTFRTDLYEQYKGNRGAPPEDLIPQFDLVKDVVSAFHIPNIGLIGYEADDCIGTLSTQFAQHANVTILTGDHDMLQLVSDSIKVAIMLKGQSNYAVHTLETLLLEKKITPAQVVDLKGLTGDTADNYPGVKGIGEKTALKLLQDYESIELILANLAILPMSIRLKIEADLDMLHLSRDLARIRCDVPITCSLEECLWSPDFQKLSAKFLELEFKGLQQVVF